MDCACGPIAMTEAIMMLGKGDSLKSNIQSELGYTPNNATETAAASYVLMYKKGLNGNPSSHDFSSSNFCGGKGNYASNGNSFLNNYGLKVDTDNGNNSSIVSSWFTKPYVPNKPSSSALNEDAERIIKK